MAPAAAPPAGQQGDEAPPDVKPLKSLIIQSQKRTREMFVGNHGQRIQPDETRWGLRECRAKRVPHAWRVHLAILSASCSTIGRRFMDSQLTGAHSLLCSQKIKIHSKVRAVLLHSALVCLLLLG